MVGRAEQQAGTLTSPPLSPLLAHPEGSALVPELSRERLGMEQCRRWIRTAGRFRRSLERSKLDFYFLFALFKSSFNVKAFLLNEGEREVYDK